MNLAHQLFYLTVFSIVGATLCVLACIVQWALTTRNNSDEQSS